MYPHFQQSKSICKVILSKKSPFSLDEVCKININTTNDQECKHHVPSILEKERCKTSQRFNFHGNRQIDKLPYNPNTIDAIMLLNPFY